MNPIWLENIIKEMAQDLKDIKEELATLKPTTKKK